MDYKKTYEEALEKAKKLYEDGTITESLKYIFPELAESEDEMIRKALIDYFRWNPNSQLLNEFTNKEVFAWLEKQKDIIEKYEDKLDRCACESWDKWYKEGKKGHEWSEEDEKIRKGIFKALSVKEARDILIQNTIQISEALSWLEKQGERKPTDKVEPKFKVWD